MLWRHNVPIKFALALGLIFLVLYCCTGCGKSLLPLGGAVVGGGAGAIGGPLTGAAGAGLGYAAGELYLAQDFKKDVVEAVSKGDAAAIAKQVLEAEKKGGFFDSVQAKVEDSIFGILRLACLGLAVFLLLPILYTRFIHKQVKKNKETMENGNGKDG